MKFYTPSEIAAQLDVKESTLRKYCLMLEKHGVTFQRNNQKQRWFNDNDVIMIRKLITLKNSADMSLEECAEMVSLWAKGTDITPDVTDKQAPHNDITELKNMVKDQQDLMLELTKRMEQQQQYIDKRLNEHDKLLMETLDKNLEARKLIAAEKEEKKQGFFSRLFKRS